ncbi:hypothetical protein OsI_36289 [Oryza sativa Indica Group]|uniref:Uncharacterized protein n=1 Tax=Oryza sativa subsp. indica TaxID=39946 RepID=B8BKS5_ORYSI|nr:hypothetical protein OsI_36289 [Oryza sativa Indica Group]
MAPWRARSTGLDKATERINGESETDVVGTIMVATKQWELEVGCVCPVSGGEPSNPLLKRLTPPARGGCTLSM